MAIPKRREENSMTNIVSVEDQLNNAKDIANQFNRLALERKELQIMIKAICLFYENNGEKEEKSKEIETLKMNGLTYEVKLVSLYDFDDVMDEYVQNQKESTIVIMDFLLEHAANSGARGIPTRRVNIRYTKRLEKQLQDKIWFYTTSGDENIGILEELFGQEHVLGVKVEEGRLSLRFNDLFINTALKHNQETVV